MLVWLLACASEPEPQDSAPEADPVGPVLTIDADTLALSAAIGETVTATLTLGNTGDELLTLQWPVLEDDTSTFEIGDLATIYLRPGDAWPFEVTYAPTARADATARLVLASDDASSPVQEVLLVGTTLAPELSLSPTTYDFGTMEAYCEDEYGFVLSNVGDADLTITDVTATGGEGVFAAALDEADGPLPWTLGPGEQRVVRALFTPTLEDVYAGGLTVTSDDPVNPTAAASLDGAGTDNRRMDDNFVTLGREVDVVFAVGGDDPTALGAALLAGLPDLVAPLDTANVDYRISAVLADDGCVVNGLQVEGSMTADEQYVAFVGMLEASGSEHTLAILERAVAESSAKGCNPDVIRPTARLVLIGLTDAAAAAPQASGVYSAYFEGAKADTDDVEAWAIAPDGSGCGVVDDAWTDVTAATGGTYVSVCDDLPTTLGAVGEAAVARQTEYPLSAIPWTDTLVVAVDGDWSHDWTYDATENAVVFDEAVAPGVGSAVRVVYTAVPVCE